MVTRKTGRPVGRPSNDLRTKPDRHAIALGVALECAGMSRTKAFQLAAALLEHKRVEKAGLSDESISGLSFFMSRSIEERGRYLSQKATGIKPKRESFTPEETAWLVAMTAIWALYLLGSGPTSFHQIRYAALSCDETEFVRDRLLTP